MERFFIKTVKFLVVTIIIMVSVSIFTFCQQEETTLNFATGMAGGAWFQRSGVLAELIKEKAPHIDIKVLPGAGLTNAPRVGTNECQLGISYPYTANAAIKGTDMYQGMGPYPDIRVITKGYGITMIVVIVPEDSAVNSVDEIFSNKKALKWAFPLQGSLDEYSAKELLAYYGCTYDDLKAWGGQVVFSDYNDIVKYYEDRQVDIIVAMAAHPASWIIQLGVAKQFNLLELSQGCIDYFVKNNFDAMVTPAGSYSGNYTGLGEVRDIPTAGLNQVLVVHNDVPEEIVYTITKIINENIDRLKAEARTFEFLNLETNWENTGAPLHPGAERYYREVGVFKD